MHGLYSFTKGDYNLVGSGSARRDGTLPAADAPSVAIDAIPAGYEGTDVVSDPDRVPHRGPPKGAAPFGGFDGPAGHAPHRRGGGEERGRIVVRLDAGPRPGDCGWTPSTATRTLPRDDGDLLRIRIAQPERSR